MTGDTDLILRCIALAEAHQGDRWEDDGLALIGGEGGSLTDPSVCFQALLTHMELNRGLLSVIAAARSAGLLPDDWASQLRGLLLEVAAAGGGDDD